MGRPSKLSADDQRELARRFINSRDDEACLALLLRVQQSCGELRRLLKCSTIDHCHFEYQLGNGRADVVLFHADGGVSIVEIKADASLHEVVGGIGQLFLYESVLAQKKLAGKSPAYIAKYLVSPITGPQADAVDLACAAAGVIFIQYAPFETIRAYRARCIQSWVESPA